MFTRMLGKVVGTLFYWSNFEGSTRVDERGGDKREEGIN